MKAYCDKEEIKKQLDSRPLTYLITEMGKLGIKLSYESLGHIIAGRNSCKVDYALAMAQILNTTVERLFYLK
jgi:hypothetical protein